MISYNNDTEKEKGWVISETDFNAEALGKCESIFCQGNGYMGVRAATEESYLTETRNCFVAGTFNAFDDKEVTELPNIPDVTKILIFIDGERLNLANQSFSGYERLLNLKTGKLVRRFQIQTKHNKKVNFIFERIVSMSDLNIIAQRVEILSDDDVSIVLVSGIDGTVSNSGFQHFSVGSKRFYNEQILQAAYNTTQSKIDCIVTTGHSIFIGKNELVNPKQKISMKSRKIELRYDIEVPKGKVLAFEKVSHVHTSRDLANKEMDMDLMMKIGMEQVSNHLKKGFTFLAENSALAWKEKIWSIQDIKINAEDIFDQLSVRFAIYHLYVMTPSHDSRMNIGAKGLSGEGYKGHTFWDTEVFLLPFFILNDSKTARSLLKYRYLCLDGARKKANENGYEGAMYPWESAWITDGEVTPKIGDADIVTGKELKIICGDIEQHITSDVVFGIWQYYQVTGDQDFMRKYGYEIIFETAIFWQSRLEWIEDNARYEIRDVIGPDEYSEHVDNNAYTNYMAHFNLSLAIFYYEELKDKEKEAFEYLNKKLQLDKYYDLWIDKTNQLYLPNVNDQMLLPQDDTYLTLPVLPLKKYKESKTRADIIKDYNMEQISNFQVSKQADVLVLFYLREELFLNEVKRANFYYYEDKCLHDSSLSYSTHAILANDLGEKDLAYELYRKAAEIDLGPDMHSPVDGLHSASMGGIWQCVVNGFGGLRMIGGNLRVEPNLPKCWNSLIFSIGYQGMDLKFQMNQDEMTITATDMKSTTGEIKLLCRGKEYVIKSGMEIVIANR